MTMQIIKFEEIIQRELDKFNPMDLAIAKISESYLALSISDFEDKDGHKTVRDARLYVKSLRVNLDKRRKESTSDALKFKQAIDKEASRLKSLIEPIEYYLICLEDGYNLELERIKKEKEDELQRIYLARVSALQDFDFLFNGINYSCEYDERKFTIDDLKNADTEVFLNFIMEIDLKYADFKVKRELQKLIEQRTKQKEDEERKEAERIAREQQEIAQAENERLQKLILEEQRAINEKLALEEKCHQDASELLRIEREKFEADKLAFEQTVKLNSEKFTSIEAIKNQEINDIKDHFQLSVLTGIKDQLIKKSKVDIFGSNCQDDISEIIKNYQHQDEISHAISTVAQEYFVHFTFSQCEIETLKMCLRETKYDLQENPYDLSVLLIEEIDELLEKLES
jgi:hypothetical protein